MEDTANAPGTWAAIAAATTRVQELGVLAAEPPAATDSTTPIKKPRKKRAPKHDFKDGRGKVFAHHHVNGGGWVADTAKVADTVFVGKAAQVFHNAVVEGRAYVGNYARVFGNAHVSDRARVESRAVVAGKTRMADDCRLLASSQAYGGVLTGSTVLHDDCAITQNPRVHSCVLRRNSRIGGYALVSETSLEDFAYIGGAGIVIKSSLHGFVTVAGNAQVMHSRLYQLNSYGSGLNDENRLKVIDQAVVVNCQDLNALLLIKGHTVIIGGSIRFRPVFNQTRFERIETINNALFPELQITRLDQFTAHNVPLSERNRAMTAAAGFVARPVNMDMLVPTRRLMSAGS